MLLLLFSSALQAATVYTLDDGLSQNSVSSIQRDERGFLWLGTEDGLNRFDGYEFRVFRHDAADSRTLAASFVTALAAAPGGLWVGTEGGGLHWFDLASEQFRRVPVGAPGLANGYVTALATGAQGELWVGLRGAGLAQVRWQGDPLHVELRVDAIPLPDAEQPAPNVWGLRMGAQGLWIATQKGAFLKPADGRPPVGLQHASLPATGRVNVDEILELGDGGLLLGTWDHGLWRRAAGRMDWQRIPHPVEPAAGRPLRILALGLEEAGTVWAGTDRGLALLDAGSEALVPMNPPDWADDAASGVLVYQVLVEADGGVWAGSWGEGLAHLGANDRWFRRIGMADGLGQKRVRAILPEADGSLLVGSFGAGVQRFRQDAVQSLPFAPGTPDVARLVWTLQRRPDGRLLVGTDHGLYLGPPGDTGPLAPWLPAGWPAALTGIRTMLPARDGGLWIGTSGGLLHLDQRDQVRRIRLSEQPAQGAADANVYALLESPDGTLVAGTWGGLFVRAPDGTVQAFRQQPGELPASIVWSLLEAPDGGFWIGSGAGLVRARGRGTGLSLAAVAVPGFDSGPVYALRSEPRGALWLATNSGLYRFDPDTGQAQNFRQRDGLLSDEFHVGASASDAHGQLYFGGLNGLVTFAPERLQPERPPPAPVLTLLMLGNQRLSPLGIAGQPPVLALAAGRGPLGVDFSAMDGDRAPTLRYRYRWTGLSSAWTELGARRSLSLSALPGGDYALAVQARSHSGMEGPVSTLLTLKVAHPWWQRPWAVGAFILLGLGLAVALARWRTRAISARSRWLQTQVEARTAELRETAQALATANARLRELSIRDGLTGLYNRRHLLELAPSQDGRHSCVLIDLDHFKAINDRYGHTAGDRVLVAFAAQLQQAAGGEDAPACGRYGGEEFLVFLPGRDRFMAARWADGIRQQLAATAIEVDPAKPVMLHCTASFGVAERETGEPLDAWIERADGALYLAKHRGRDRVEIAG